MPERTQQSSIVAKLGSSWSKSGAINHQTPNNSKFQQFPSNFLVIGGKVLPQPRLLSIMPGTLDADLVGPAAFRHKTHFITDESGEVEGKNSICCVFSAIFDGFGPPGWFFDRWQVVYVVVNNHR
jgi:hypothetical protein